MADDGEIDEERKPIVSAFPAEGGDAYLMLAQARFDQQMATWDAYDAKANNHLLTAVAEAAFLLALLALKPPMTHHPTVVSWIGLGLAALGAVAVVSLAWIVQRVQSVDSYPTAADAWGAAWSSNRENESVAWQLARSLEVAYENNCPAVKTKATMLRYSGWALVVMTGVSTATAISLVYT
ncbi:MAG: hypothetical protein Q8M73_00230 [Actinomycetota bacterium]|nr:hypothetical protein [Actinomycetota bacterium]